MCGICGLAALDGGAVDTAPLDAMSATLAHRGPDDAASVTDGPVALAARRLAIIDLDGGRQPVASEDGRVHGALNGEILNHASLRDDLRRRGHRFASRCDTEVLVHLYEERGERMLDALRGMFAIAIWDARERRLLLARDGFGIKPLYWRAAGGVLAFGSELKALRVLPGFRGELDPDAVEAYFTFNSIPSPLTIFGDVRKLEPGTLLSWRPGRSPEIRRWCRPAPVHARDVRDEDERELAAELADRLRDSVRAHLVSDVPVGVWLSGGVDSGLLAALAAQESGERLRTFSIGFHEPSFDELDRARLVAARLGADHHEAILGPDDAATLPLIAAAFDEPYADSSALPTFAVSRLTREHVKVALSGEGGDELFGGYHTYAADLLAPRLAGVAAVARPLVERLPSSSRRVSLDYRARRFVRAAQLPPLERHHGWKEILSPELRAQLLAPLHDGRAPRDPLDRLRARYAETAGAEPLARLQDADLAPYLADDLLTKTDRMSMLHSVEVRVPFLDPVVAELALALPTSAKVRGLAKKRLLRAVASTLLPRQVARGAKRGFSIPMAAWLRGELLPMARDLLAPDALRRGGVLEPAPVTRLLDEHVARRDDHSRALWGMLCFVLWQEQMRR
ncbi:MAG TPA: asparagine synthase (glutamine-hydrolyzing) [Solirubrobacteraceae bacterium]|jgi:asparagine synthase (glutamine-hydrolysing)|nr:asparagine synthase (glutamine-hydrolyzing) [Solirubrobacteraceae bacterium]